MVVLSIYGKIEPMCISQKLKLYVSNLPREEHNNWNKELFCEFEEALAIKKLHNARYDLNKCIDLNNLLTKRHLPIHHDTEAAAIQEIVDNMICLYMDFSYEDMPLGNWDTNPFDSRCCEDDYSELIIDFLQFISNRNNHQIPDYIYSSSTNFGQASMRLFYCTDNTDDLIENLLHWGKKLDNFLQTKNDYLLFDYIVRALHNAIQYDTFHFFKLYSLCQLFLEKENERELDKKLPQFLDIDLPTHKKASVARILRQMRNCIAHGNFDGLEKKTEAYAKLVMDGKYMFDYAEYSRKNWVLINSCCLLADTVLQLILLLLEDKDKLMRIKNMPS